LSPVRAGTGESPGGSPRTSVRNPRDTRCRSLAQPLPLRPAERRLAPAHRSTSELSGSGEVVEAAARGIRQGLPTTPPRLARETFLDSPRQQPTQQTAALSFQEAITVTVLSLGLPT